MKFVILIVLVCSTVVTSQPIVGQSTVMRCEEATRARPQIGVAYRGQVTNDDYKFSAHVPNGLTGWGGVEQNAPFHGFTIFLDPKMESCIIFEVHLRVDEADAPDHPRTAAPLQLGTAQAWKTVKEGTAQGLSMTKITTSFSSKLANQIDDGQILLIAPTVRLEEAKMLYQAFLDSVKFDGKRAQPESPRR